jgi:hypothetical protein
MNEQYGIQSSPSLLRRLMFFIPPTLIFVNNFLTSWTVLNGFLFAVTTAMSAVANHYKNVTSEAGIQSIYVDPMLKMVYM